MTGISFRRCNYSLKKILLKRKLIKTNQKSCIRFTKVKIFIVVTVVRLFIRYYKLGGWKN